MAEEKKKAAPVKNTNAVKKEEKKLGFFQRIGKWFRLAIDGILDKRAVPTYNGAKKRRR